MEEIQQFIQHLQLQPHPEGGYYASSYRSSEFIKAAHLPNRFNADRCLSTAIYFLLAQNDFSAFHRIKSDECWHFYAGGTLLIYEINPQGELRITKLGNNFSMGEKFQYVVNAGNWFASCPAPGSSFSLVGCTVAPGFDFDDFEMASGQSLAAQFPHHEQVIRKLSR